MLWRSNKRLSSGDRPYVAINLALLARPDAQAGLVFSARGKLTLGSAWLAADARGAAERLHHAAVHLNHTGAHLGRTCVTHRFHAETHQSTHWTPSISNPLA